MSGLIENNWIQLYMSWLEYYQIAIMITINNWKEFHEYFNSQGYKSFNEYIDKVILKDFKK